MKRGRYPDAKKWNHFCALRWHSFRYGTFLTGGAAVAESAHHSFYFPGRVKMGSDRREGDRAPGRSGRSAWCGPRSIQDQLISTARPHPIRYFSGSEIPTKAKSAMLFERSAPGNATWPWPNLGHRDAIETETATPTIWLATNAGLRALISTRLSQALLLPTELTDPLAKRFTSSRIRRSKFERVIFRELQAWSRRRKSLTFLDEVAGPYHVTLKEHAQSRSGFYRCGAWLREANNTHSYLLPQGTFTDTGIYLTVRDQ